MVTCTRKGPTGSSGWGFGLGPEDAGGENGRLAGAIPLRIKITTMVTRKDFFMNRTSL
jgi:hypothetical protein